METKQYEIKLSDGVDRWTAIVCATSPEDAQETALAQEHPLAVVCGVREVL